MYFCDIQRDIFMCLSCALFLNLFPDMFYLFFIHGEKQLKPTERMVIIVL